MTVQQYTARPLAVLAVQWTGGNFAEVRELIGADLTVLTEDGRLVLLDADRTYPMVPVGCYVGVLENGKVVAFSPLSFEALYREA